MSKFDNKSDNGRPEFPVLAESGLGLMRLAESVFLPLRFDDFAKKTGCTEIEEDNEDEDDEEFTLNFYARFPSERFCEA